MLRVIALFVLVGAGAAIALAGGRVGPVDLTAVPLPLIAFAATTIVVLLGLRRI